MTSSIGIAAALFVFIGLPVILGSAIFAIKGGR